MMTSYLEKLKGKKYLPLFKVAWLVLKLILIILVNTVNRGKSFE